MKLRLRLSVFLLNLLLLVGIFSVLVPVRSVQALVDPTPVIVGVDLSIERQTIWEKITKAFDRSYKIIGQSLFQTTLQTYLNNLAYNTATFIASGAPGGKPLVRTKSFARVLNDSRDAAYGDFIGNLSEDFFKGSGLNLCAPSLDVQANITLGIIADVGGQAPKPPKCELNDIKAKWTQFGQSLDSGQWLAQAMVNLTSDQRTGLLGALVDPNQNDLGIFLQVSDQASQKALQASDIAKITEQTCQGYKDKGASISDDVLVHCAKVMGVDQNAYRDALLEASLIKTEDVFINAAKLFAKSLTAKLLNKYISGSWSLSNLYGGGTTNLRDSLINQLRNKVDLRRFGSATQLFADLKTVNIDSIDDFDYLQNLASCPPDRKIAQPDNCTLDNAFLAAINNKETVAQALAQGHLKADWPLISYLNASQNGDKSCFQNGYCYGNIARLRSYRILPLGWEIAAALSPIARPVTLGEAVDCFDNGPKCIMDPAANIFYHLVDPNWVLTAPSTQCKALVYGPTLEDVTSNQRQQICVDRPSCLAQDSKGNCIGGYGYCTQERNIWRFSGESCQEQYSSCQVLTRRDNGAKYSYLQNTLESCDAGQAGCSWYSLHQENVGTAAAPDYQWNPNDRIYLNNKLTSCTQQDAGCQEFINPETSGINILANGNFDTYQLNIATDNTNGDFLDDTLVDTFSGWSANGTNFSAYTASGNNTYIGPTAIKVVGDGQLSATAQAGSLQGTTMTLSWYGKADTACTANAALGSQNTSAASAAVNYTTSWQRFQLTHTFDLDTTDHLVTVFLGSLASCGSLHLDGVKVELGTSPTNYSDYGSAGKVYLNGTRVSCKAEEVGCNLYSPANGGATVPGVVTNADRCPTECVGYQTYIQLPTAFETMEQPTAGTTNVNFIASTAKQCNATDVGCSAFTNLDEVAAGGEGQHYYSFLRQCVAANFGITYYTLEGSDTSGFQVRTWQVLKSNLDGGPCTNVAPGGTTCQDTGATQATCQASDVSTNPNCREFFDTDGASKFRLQDKVIFADSNCHPLRRSSGVVYSGLDKESRTCSAAAVGCTEFRGNQGNNLRQISNDTFESGSYQPWQAGTVTPVYSAESTNSGGHSMSWTSGVVSRSEGTSIVPGREYYLNFWLKAETAGTEFKAFLGKFDGSQTKCNGGVCEFTAASVSPIQPTTGWQQYQLGPLHVDTVTASDAVLLQLEASPKVFVDNIILKESVSNLTVVANSWKTPASCDQPFVGANLGCQQYKGPNNTTLALRSFSQICRQEAVGCQAVINTQNSNSPYQEIYHPGDKSQITVPADTLEYVVVDQKKTCSAAYQGCMMMGKPTFNRDLPETDPDYVKTYTPVFQINDPDRYNQQLCQDSGLFCQEYSDTKGNSVYYRDPYNRTCTYKEGVSIQGVSFSGWFQTDSLQAGRTPIGCYSQGIPPLTQDQFAIHPTADPLYGGWVGTCPASQNQCSEFVDTQATDGDNLFFNASFTNGTAGWASWSAYGNTLGASTFTANAGTATISTNPTGTGLFFQRLFTQDPQSALHIQNTETYNLSADVKIDNFFADDKSGGAVQAVMRCVWDSPYDQDYCGSVGTDFGVTVDYSKPCSSNDQCGANNFCYKAAQGYCQSPTDKTNVACSNNSRCSSLGAGYTCETNYGYQSTDSRNNRRDHLTEYYVGADIKKRDTIQSLNVVANIGADSQGDELVYCEPTFRVSSGYYQQSNAGCPASGNNDANPNCFNTACTNSGQSCNPVLTSCGSGTCGGASKVEFSNVSLRKVKSYFYLDNDNIDDSSCNGQVSKNTGCILFDDANDNDKTYNSYLTYLASDKAGGKPVSPVVCDPNSADAQLRSCTNDANRVIKVNRDRECSQWLACKSSSQIFDPQTKGYKQVCSEVGLCDKYSTSGDLLNCANWLPESQTKLDYASYVSRDTRYEATDYAGMSMYNRYPVDNLHLLDISVNKDASGPDSQKPDFRLVKFIDCISGGAPCSQDVNGSTNDKYGSLLCGPGNIGKIFDHNGQPECVVGIDGSRFDTISPYVVKVSTRAYAEQDSPFPQSLASGPINKNRKVTFGFQQANICDSSVASCETGYYKMQYGSTSLVRYYSINGPLGGVEVPTCICEGGDLDGTACRTTTVDNDKNNTTQIEQQCPGGNPVQLRRSDVYLNWPGYCLEPDTSTHINASQTQYACLSWLPVDIAPGGTDYFNQYREAGYSYKAPAYYCLETSLKEVRSAFQTGCISSVDRIWKDYQKVGPDGSPLNGGDAIIYGEKHNDRSLIDGKYFAQKVGSSCGGGLFQNDNYFKLWPITQRQIGNGPIEVVDHCVGPVVKVVNFEGAKYWLTERCEADYDAETLRITGTGESKITDVGKVLSGDSEPYASCNYLAEAVSPQGTNAAITNVFWSDYKLADGSDFDISKAPGATNAPNYKLGQDDAPFGSAVPSSGLIPSDFPRLDVKSAGTVPRAGSPYACANEDSVCGLLADKNSRVAVDGWVTPGVFGYVPNPNAVPVPQPHTYADGMKNLRAIFQRVFGIYRYTLGDSCTSRVCDSGLYGGNACSGSGSSTCSLSSRNTCKAISKCVNSPWGANVSCTGCANGFSPNNAGECVQNFSGQLSCLSGCTPYFNNGSAVSTANDCNQAPYLCAYKPSINGNAVCQAAENKMDCRPSGNVKKCYDTAQDRFTVIECKNTSDCVSAVQAANEITFCAPSNAHYCTGPDFDTDASQNWFKNVQDCYDTVTTDLGVTLPGFIADGSGNTICQAQNATCKLASQVNKLEGGVTKPYCTFKPDTYQPLCNPDTDPNCDYGSANAIRTDALPLDGTMPVSAAQGTTAHPAKYYADTNFGPIVAEANCTDVSGQCTVGRVGNFSVNGEVNGTISEEKKSTMLANISFYAMAYKNHMPIRSIAIDWDDGSVQSNVGYYKNNWSQCDPKTTIDAAAPSYTWGANNTLDFAGTAQACEEGIRNYFHVYRFDEKFRGRYGCSNDYACYKPSITVQDNWGWCTNNLWSPVGTACPGSAAIIYGGGQNEDVIKIKVPTN